MTNQEFEYAVRYSYYDDPDPKDPGCVDIAMGLYQYLDGGWEEGLTRQREHFERFAQRHGCLVELLRRPVGEIEVLDSRGSFDED